MKKYKPTISWGNASFIMCRFKKVNVWNKTASTRPYWRIYWNPTPGAAITVRNKTYYPDKDHLMAIPPGISIEQKLESPFLTLFLHLRISYPYDFYPELVYFKIGEETKKMAKSLAVACKHNQDLLKSSPKLINYTKFILSRVLCELDSDKVTSLSMDHRIRNSIDIINKSMKCGISNQELSRMAGLSKSAYLKLFKQEVNITPQQYLLQKRIEKSICLIGDNHLSIEQISDECGFYDRAYFSRLFKREIGHTPAQYRLLFSTNEL